MNMTIVWTFDPRISGSEMWAVLPWWLVSHIRSLARMIGGPIVRAPPQPSRALELLVP